MANAVLSLPENEAFCRHSRGVLDPNRFNRADITAYGRRSVAATAEIYNTDIALIDLIMNTLRVCVCVSMCARAHTRWCKRPCVSILVQHEAC